MKKCNANIRNENDILAGTNTFDCILVQRIKLLTLYVGKTKEKLLENISLILIEIVLEALCPDVVNTFAFPIPVINIVLKRKDLSKSFAKLFQLFYTFTTI